LTQPLTHNPVPAKGNCRGPAKPTYFPELPAEPRAFQRLDTLAAHIQAVRAGRCLRLQRGHAAIAGSDTFPVFRLYVTETGCDTERYLATIAVQGLSQLTLEAVIAAANPDLPPGFLEGLAA
jgi:hypothetical protein